MANWKYNLDEEGKKLRSFINSDEDDSVESCVETLKQLSVCAKSLLNKLIGIDKNIWSRELEDLIEEIEMAGDLEDCDLYEALDAANYNLNTFYDICGDCMCWIGL